MTNFIVNKGYGNQARLDAARYELSDKWVIFYNGSDEAIYSVQADRVGSIEVEGVVDGHA